MSLPPALLQRLAQRGLVDKQKVIQLNEGDNTAQAHSLAVENEEVIAEDYDEMEEESDQHQIPQQEEYQYPSQYDLQTESVLSGMGGRKRAEDNYWLTQLKARMAEAGSPCGFKGCPNKYNVWHKCTLYCVNRWAEGIPKPSAEYMKRYNRLKRKYPLPNGWTEMYDPGCGCYYFACEADNVVSWLPPTHPQSVITKSAAAVRKQMEESVTGDDTITDEDDDEEDRNSNEGDDGVINESAQARHHREVEEIINASIKKAKSSTLPNRNKNNLNPNDTQEFPSLEESSDCPTVSLPRRQKCRDLDKAISKQNRKSDRLKDERGYNESNHFHVSYQVSHNESEHLETLDQNSYSHTSSSKWSSEGREKRRVEEYKEAQKQPDKSGDINDSQSD